MTRKTIFIGISGPSASGKSLLAKTIYEELGSKQVVIISQDTFYKDRADLPFEERAEINYDHPDAFDEELMLRTLLALQAGKTVHLPIYDYSQHARTSKTHEVGPHRIVILEGILVFEYPKIRELMDISIFMEAPLDTCLIRRLRRDVNERGRDLDSVLKQYEETVRPMFLQFIEPGKRFADIIIPHGGKNRIAIDIIKAQVQALLQ